MSNGTAAAVVLASGSGTRVGADLNKVFLPLRGAAIVAWSLRAMAAVPQVGALVLVVRPQDEELARQMPDVTGVEIVHGGAARQDSELMALRHLAPRIASGEIDVVLIHDAARPLVTGELTTTILETARAHGGAVPGLPRDDVLLASEDGRLAEADPGTLMAMQTPQGFLAGPLLAAYEQAAADGFYGTDTAACVARYTDIRVRCVPGDERNIKITYRHDLLVADQFVMAGH